MVSVKTFIIVVSDSKGPICLRLGPSSCSTCFFFRVGRRGRRGRGGKRGLGARGGFGFVDFACEVISPWLVEDEFTLLLSSEEVPVKVEGSRGCFTLLIAPLLLAVETEAKN